MSPGGWINIDSGDLTRAAAEMRAKLNEALRRKVKVAAILLTHWHCGDGSSRRASKVLPVCREPPMKTILRARSCSACGCRQRPVGARSLVHEDPLR